MKYTAYVIREYRIEFEDDDIPDGVDIDQYITECVIDHTYEERMDLYNEYVDDITEEE